MKTKIQIQSIPEAEPISNAVVSVRSLATGITIDTVFSDEDGFALVQRSGHLEPYYLYMSGLPGGDKFWRSDEMMTAGPTSPWDWPTALLSLGNGVIAGYENDLLPAITSGTMLVVFSGAALIQGHPFVVYQGGEYVEVLSRPSSGTRTDRVVVRLYPADSATTPGKADIVRLAGADTIGTVPDLTQTSEIYEMPLAQVNVPAAGTLSVTDERQMLQGERHEPVTDQVIVDGPIVTDAAGGEALSGLLLTLSLPTEETYDITASLSAIQGPVAGSTSWANVATYGPSFNSIALSNPGQIAIDSTGRIFIADTGNNRLISLLSTGSFSWQVTFAGITGVCVDPSDNIYVAYSGFTRSYTSGLALRWTITNGGTLQLTHLATDGTTLFGTYTSVFGHRVHRYLCSTGAAATIPYFGSTPNPGSGNGEFNTPWGICITSSSTLAVVDQGNARVQIFNLAGTYLGQFPIPSGSRGIALDETQPRMWVACTTSNEVRSYTAGGLLMASFSQANPSGIGRATGNVFWVSNATAGTIAKWDEVIAGSGYGQLAIDTATDLGTYVGPGNRDAPIKVFKTWSAAGGYEVESTVRAFGKATSGDATFTSLVLRAEARPRR